MAGNDNSSDRTLPQGSSAAGTLFTPSGILDSVSQFSADAAAFTSRLDTFSRDLGPGLAISPDVNIRPNQPGEWTRNLAGDNTPARIPLLMTTEVMARQNRYLSFWVSPENVQWQFRLRGSLQETRGGWIQHYWKDNRRNTFFDEPEVTFTFQSGNIMPVRVTTARNPVTNAISQTQVSLPTGLLNLYEFMELLDQPKVMSDGRNNYVYILYSSLVFPKIVLHGFFTPDAGTGFSEGAQDNAEVKWTGTFKVAGTYPSFNSANQLTRTWNEVQTTLGFDVVYAASAFTTIPQIPRMSAEEAGI